MHRFQFCTTLENGRLLLVLFVKSSTDNQTTNFTCTSTNLVKLSVSQKSSSRIIVDVA